MSSLARYDRQIRAWGFETQKKLEEAKFLFIGVNATSIECMKNLILAGASVIDYITFNGESLPFFLERINPQTNVRMVQSDVDFRFYTVIAVFSSYFDSTKLPTDCVVLRCEGLSAVLSFNRSFNSFQSVQTESVVHLTLFGGILSQLFVDYLPPLREPTAVSVTLDPNTLSSRVLSQ